MNLIPGFRYKVVKGSDDDTFRVGDVITFQKDHIILHDGMFSGSINEEDMKEALQGCHVIIDQEWLAKKKERLKTELEQLEGVNQ